MISPPTFSGNSSAVKINHRYLVAIQREDQRAGPLLVSPDWVPAVEWWHWRRIQLGLEPASMPPPPVIVTPVWDSQLGMPYVAGIRLIHQSSRESEKVDSSPLWDIPLAFFYPSIQTIFSTMTLVDLEQLVRSGKVTITADPIEQSADSPIGRFQVKEISNDLPIRETSLCLFEEQLTDQEHPNWDGRNASDFPVFIGSSVVHDMIGQSQKAGESETGGVLVGFLHRDPKSSQIFVEITAQIPALHAQGGRYSLGFTPEAWTSVQDALSLRRTKEIPLGWFHSHPFFCANCPLERQRTCSLSLPFFSQDDKALHREVFPRAFNVAFLVTNQGPAGLAVNLFGWRHGMIAERSFFTIPKTTV